MARCLQVCGNSAYGGAAPLVIRWCRHLLSLGWQVDVLATDDRFVRELRRIRGLGIIDNILIPREIAPGADARAFVQLFRLFRRERYVVVHTYTATPSFLGRIAARLAGIPVILHHQAGWTVTEFSSLTERLMYTPLEYLATLASSRSICVSHAVAKQARQLHIAPQRRLVTICNGIDPRPFVEATEDGSGGVLRQQLGIPRRHVMIGNTGRLAPQKDNQTLIRAMPLLALLLGDVPFTLVLAGDGPDHQTLQDLVQSLGLGEHVQLLGFRSDIPAFLAALDIFVSPSLWEGLSISLLEAMAAARPIIASAIAPNAELIEHEITGLLVPPMSAEHVAEAIARLVRDPGLAQRCARAARQRVLERYTIGRMLQETQDLYERLCRPTADPRVQIRPM